MVKFRFLLALVLSTLLFQQAVATSVYIAPLEVTIRNGDLCFFAHSYKDLFMQGDQSTTVITKMWLGLRPSKETNEILNRLPEHCVQYREFFPDESIEFLDVNKDYDVELETASPNGSHLTFRGSFKLIRNEQGKLCLSVRPMCAD